MPREKNLKKILRCRQKVRVEKGPSTLSTEGASLGKQKSERTATVCAGRGEAGESSKKPSTERSERSFSKKSQKCNKRTSNDALGEKFAAKGVL